MTINLDELKKVVVVSYGVDFAELKELKTADGIVIWKATMKQPYLPTDNKRIPYLLPYTYK